MNSPRVAGLVLAGGTSSRMIVNSEQTDKAWVDWQGQPLIKHAIQRLQVQVDCLMVNAAPTDKSRALYEALDIVLLGDINAKIDATINNESSADTQSSITKQGPLAGILAALIHCQTYDLVDWLQVVPCDAPNVPKNLVEQLLIKPALGDNELSDTSIRMPTSANDQQQPMFALLPISITKALQNYFDAGGRSLLAFASGERQKTIFVPMEESAINNFANINSLADFERLS
jgi:molybdopterin-guanine dinucleotide biosynthesis protein A